MSKLKITKGNWSFSPQKGTKGYCVQAQIWTTEKEEYVANIKSTENEEEATANAKLIAAAPELLEALIQLKNWVIALDDWAGGTSLDPPAELAIETIKKATE